MSKESVNSQRDPGRDNRRLVRRVAIVAVAMFGFGFALVPLYDIFCEVTGLRIVDKGRVDQDEQVAFEVVQDRWITVTFDATTNSKLPWSFGPNETSLKVRPGEAVKTLYTATNRADYPIIGNAVPSVAPAIGNKYFAKTECFCFTEQLLAAGETREMPVLFIIDPELPEDVHTLTLSYTFYMNDGATEALAAQSPVSVTEGSVMVSGDDDVAATN